MSLDSDIHQCNVSRIREVTGFPSYMLLCGGLTVLILRTLSGLKNAASTSSSPRPCGKAKLFAALALTSLGLTWYYMLKFFAASYDSWASTQDIPARCLTISLWLKDTQLFKQAWWTAVATPARFWWTQQIFFFTTAWSVFLGREGHRRSIPHLWAYMLLGQVVAISFATNLFFLAVVLKPLHQPQQPGFPTTTTTTTTFSSRALLPLLLHIAPVVISLASVALIPYIYTSNRFLAVLSIPHLLLFLPLFKIVALQRSDKDGRLSTAVSDRNYTIIYLVVIISSFFLQAKTTVQALTNDPSGGSIWTIPKALYEYPAVSSVGWDVIMCWLSWTLWTLTQPQFQAEKEKGL